MNMYEDNHRRQTRFKAKTEYVIDYMIANCESN